MKRKVIKKRLVLKKNIRSFLTRSMLTVIIILMTLIIVKVKPSLKKVIVKNVYDQNIKFGKAHNLYEKYFGTIAPFNNLIKEEKPVFKENLIYKQSNNYKDGVALTVSKNYMVPALESGIVVFLGKKSDYGKTIIIEQTDGVEVFYSNVNAINLKLYDYVEKGKLIGETQNDKLYLVFYKDGKYLNYKNFI